MLYYIGIDLAWKENGDTGLCILDEHGAIVLWEVQPFSNVELLESLNLYIQDAAIIAIDAPISVPNENGSRASENQLRKTKIHQQRVSIFSTNRSFMIRNYGAVRGEDIARMIEENNSKFSINKNSSHHFIFETFPTANCIGVFKKKIKYKTGTNKKAVVLEGLKTLVYEMKSHPWFSKQISIIEKMINPVFYQATTRRDLKLLDDKIDALFCAYTAFQFDQNPSNIQRFGEGLEQLIIVVED